MFYVGDTLWMEWEEWLEDIPDFRNFSGHTNWFNGTKRSFDKGEFQSFQDPVTGEWMPAVIYPGETEYWYDKGNFVRNPETYPWG